MKVIAALIAAALAATPALAFDEDDFTAILNACSADIAEDCPEARAGGRRLIACFFSRADRLTPRCADQVAATPDVEAILTNYVNFLAQSCDVELRRFCAEVTPGRGRIAQCLGAREDQLRAGCRNALNASGF